MSAQITFVGSGDAFAGGGRFQTCLLLDGGDEPLLVDCGATTLVALRRLGIDPASIGYVALSHLHGDHFGGLPWLMLDGQFGHRTRPFVIAGPTGTEQRVHQTIEALYPGLPGGRPYETRFIEFTARTPQRLGPATITAYPVKHSNATAPHALRIEYADSIIVYSGDTEWTDTLVEASAGADVFVCECNFFETRVPGHLDYRTLMAHLPELDCDRLVITHMGEEMLAHVNHIELEAASDGAVIEIAGRPGEVVSAPGE